MLQNNMKKILRFLVSVLAVLSTLFLSLSVSATDEVATECDWLFGRQIELYAYLLKGADISDGLRDKLQEGFNRFAFEYYLLCKTNPTASSPWWRGQLRERIHQEGKNQRYFNDPAGVQQFFKDGRLVSSLVLAPVKGLDLAGLSENKYRTLVREFQLVFFDSTNVFPLSPIPNVIVTGSTKDHLDIGAFLAGRSWRLLSRDKLPVRFQTDPFRVFQLLGIAGRYYYLPAFLRICERGSEEVSGLPKELLTELAGDSAESIELQSKFTDEQRRCIYAFFEEWFQGNGQEAVSLSRLHKKFSIKDSD